ncbi:hypothetical protein ACFL04_04215 [Patescibacteria group bacterium]
MASWQLEVIDGPSKFDVLISLFVGKNHEQKRVEFKTGPRGWNSDGSDFAVKPESIFPVILGMEREDTSGECWILKGRSIDKNGAHMHIINFDFRNRKGRIENYKD